MTRVRHKQFSPVLKGLKGRNRARGKAFPKGNTIGMSTRFQKGVCPNPGGRPSNKEISKAVRAKLAEKVPGDSRHRTYAEKIVDVWVSRGLGGNISAIAAIADRAEGRPAVSVQFNDTEDPLTQLIASMDRVSKQIGPPEGMITPEQRQLPAGDDDDGDGAVQ